LVAYVSFVAIANILLGMMLARIIAPREGGDCQLPTKQRRESQLPAAEPERADSTQEPHEPSAHVGETIAAAAPRSEANDTTTEPNESTEAAVEPKRAELAEEPPEHLAQVGEEIVAAAPRSEANDRKPEPGESTSAAAAPIKSWDDFSHQLSDVKARTHFCRSIQDARLAEEAALQLRACAKEWYGQFERCLRGEKLDDATQALVEGKSMNAVEMFAAQIETTLSNIEALDFTTSVDDVLNVLERELEMLDRQQKSVGQSQADSGPQT